MRLLLQFDPSMHGDDGITETPPAAALALRLRAHHVAFTRKVAQPKKKQASCREEEPLVTNKNSCSDNEDEVTELSGAATSAASDDNLAYLRHLASDKTGEVTRDEFSIWLLYLLGRIDAADVEIVRETFGEDHMINHRGSSICSPTTYFSGVCFHFRQSNSIDKFRMELVSSAADITTTIHFRDIAIISRKG